MSESTPLLPKTGSGPKKRHASTPKKKLPKLGTFEGVFLPTSLNVLSILMFLRFGFIVGQMGILGSVLLLVMSYFINVLTVLSISAISTNGTVKGGGAYYMISRSLGPEFGGAIGIIFFIGQILNASLNVVGFIEPLLVNFGKVDGDIVAWLPVSRSWEIIYSTILLALCTAVAMVGSSLVSKTALWLFVLLTLSTLSIPFSALVVPSGFPLDPPLDNLWYSGISWTTLKENLLPHFTSGAAGSVQPPGVPETFRNMFGIFFPATAGIFAGASMSGDLSNPSRSIPKGTLYGLLTSFVLYFLVIVSLGASTPRELLYKDIKIIQSVNISGLIIILGEVSTSLFSVIMGVVGAASMLNAIADDRIIPGLSFFSVAKKSVYERKKAELYSILFTWLLAQVFLFADINEIATFITMAFLMTFLVTNLACFLLKVGSAPNFRPSFKYFNSKTALTGGLASVIAMYICDGVSATSIIVFLVILILTIHYTTPPSKFGDISQLLIYHQVRKYLLRLKLQMNVKYWRPQILLLCDDPQTSWSLIGFCNHLKKGGLYVLGHVVLLADDSNGRKDMSSEFNVESFKEIRKQKNAWVKLRDMAKIKAFVQIAIGPSLPWGVRNVFLGSGLGGMRPNITVLGFYDFHKHGLEHPLRTQQLILPTDECRKEKKVSINQWVQIVEDLVIMQATVAVAANFGMMKVPVLEMSWLKEKLFKMQPQEKKYIDLYPIQMSTVCLLDNGKSVLSTNFDTYTLILQLGSILSTVDEWKKNGYVLRIIAFVEIESEREDERKRLGTLLESLRIDAEVKIICFEDGIFDTYNIMVKGVEINSSNRKTFEQISLVLGSDKWWNNLVEARKTIKEIDDQRRRNASSKIGAITFAREFTQKLKSLALTPKSPSDMNNNNNLGRSLKNNRRYTLSNLHEHGLSMSLNMSAQGGEQFFKYDVANESSDDSDSEKEFIRDDNTSEEGSTISTSGVIPPVNAFQSTASVLRQPVKQAGSIGESEVCSRARTPAGSIKQKYFNDLKSQSPERLSARTSKTNLRPNFQAGKIPQSKIREDEDDQEEYDENEQPRASINFVAEEDVEEETEVIEEVDDEELEEDDDDDCDDNENEELDTEDTDGNIYDLDREKEKISDDKVVGPRNKETPVIESGDTKIIHNTKSKSDLTSNKKPQKVTSMSSSDLERKKAMKNSMKLKLSGKGMTFEPKAESTEKVVTPSILAAEEIQEHLKSPYFMAEDDPTEGLSRQTSILDLSSPGDAPDQENKITYKRLQKELHDFNFNDLPAKGQHLVLNELMKKTSTQDKTAVIFSTLPAPNIGTHLDDNESLDYVENLAIWVDDLVPVLLLNSQTVTVTTSL